MSEYLYVDDLVESISKAVIDKACNKYSTKIETVEFPKDYKDGKIHVIRDDGKCKEYVFSMTVKKGEPLWEILEKRGGVND